MVKTARILALLPFFAALNWDARAEVVVSRYSVSLGVLHIGDAVLKTVLNSKNYNITVSADVGALFDNKRMQGEASGQRKGAKLQPDHYQMVMAGGDENNVVDLRFTGSAAKVVQLSPPISERVLANSIPFAPGHLRGVLDPLSALVAASLRPASTSGDLCYLLLPVFTGYARFDLGLRVNPDPEALQDKAVLRCAADYIPIAGVLGPRALKIEFGFTRLSAPQVWLLEQATLLTPLGKVKVERTETRVG
jgi:Protein of unknown function (DUF3108)